MTANNEPVSLSRRTLAAWALLMIASVSGTVVFATHGDRVIRAVEAQRLLRRAETHINASRPDEAVPLLTRAVEVKPDSFPARRLLVRTLLRSGRHAEAAEWAQEGVEQGHGGAMGLLDEVRRETMYAGSEGANK